MSITYFIVRTVLVLYTLRGEAEQVTCWRRDRVIVAFGRKVTGFTGPLLFETTESAGLAERLAGTGTIVLLAVIVVVIYGVKDLQ